MKLMGVDWAKGKDRSVRIPTIDHGHIENPITAAGVQLLLFEAIGRRLPGVRLFEVGASLCPGYQASYLVTFRGRTGTYYHEIISHEVTVDKLIEGLT